MSNLFWLTDAQMARLQPFFPKSHGKPRVDDRRVLSGIIFINRNGLRWCDARKIMARRRPSTTVGSGGATRVFSQG
jgi:transposase